MLEACGSFYMRGDAPSSRLRAERFSGSFALVGWKRNCVPPVRRPQDGWDCIPLGACASLEHGVVGSQAPIPRSWRRRLWSRVRYTAGRGHFSKKREESGDEGPPRISSYESIVAFPSQKLKLVP